MGASRVTACRYDRDAETYLIDGEPCRVDDYGDRTHHCTARRTCSQHIGADELTCARCLGRTRQDIRQIVDRAALMLPEALVAGVDSEAAMMAGPGADPRAWSGHRLAAIGHLDHWLRKSRITERQYTHARTLIDDDEFQPYNVLTRWHMMLAEDYGHPLPDKMTLADSAAYLDRILHRVAHDGGQDFPLLAREIRKCRAHLEAVLSDSLAPERGAPCPTCKDAGKFVRLVREYGHYCDDETCEQQFHYLDDTGDVWRCPANREHWWNPRGYADLLEERKGA